MSFFTELKRRNVFKVGAAYLVVGWVMIEVASTVAPHLNLPEWAPRLITFMVIIGFPLALVLAWIFDMTPEGVQVTQGGTGNKRFYGTVAVIAAAALAWFFIKAPEEATVPEVVTVAAPAVEARPSIAVLAFEDLSQEGDQAYFARGISEELLNILAGVGGLKVASRTSAFSFAGTSTPLPEIARQLDVAHVLEGSVRKQGNRVRITAQLIDAATDAHLWSANYDRDLTDIFAVQEDIAQSITDALQVVLGTREVSVEAPTQNLDAYELFLRGRSRFYQRVELDAATEDLQTAVTLDPEFAEAWTYLGAVAYVLSDGGYPSQQDLATLYATYETATARALALDPDIPLALAMHAQSVFNVPGAENFATGLALLERVASRVTEDTTPRLWLALQYLQLGYIDRALASLQQVVAQDPLVAINNGYLGLALLMAGREDAGIRYVRRAAELSGHEFWVNFIAGDLVGRGEIDRARALIMSTVQYRRAETVEIDPDYFSAVDALTDVLGNDKSMGEVLTEFRRQYPSNTVGMWILTTMAADTEWMIEWAASPLSQRTFHDMALTAWLPAMQALREHPAYFNQMRHWGLADYWATHGYPTGCQLVRSPQGDHLDCAARRAP